jgi:Calx-beta domain/FG-GAP-like repeat
MNANFIPSLITGPQEPSDDDFNAAGGEIFATFSPWASWLSDGNPFAPTPTTGLPAVAGGSADGQGDPGSVVAVSSGGITINLIFDTAALAAPASFRAGIQQAVAILAAAISDKITVNLKIDYSGTGGGAAAGPDHGLLQSYSSIRADLINNATPGDTLFNALSSGTTIQGQSSVAVWNAQLKLWGLMAANDSTTDDGSATFATDINPNLLVGVALHELTHAMGRVPYGPQPDIFDFFRFASSGTRLFQAGATAPAAYFSLDGGNTKVADYGRTSDASDFLNSGVQGPSDPFNEFYTGSTSQQLTAADLKQLDALGFHLVAANTGSVSVNDVSITEGNSGTKIETFTVTRSGGTAAFDVNFTTADGSATVADSDYVAKAGVLHFDTGVNTQTISVTINGDTKIESNETFSISLSGATNGATISDNLATGTIIDDDGNHVRDFNADGHSDILWQNANGTPATWLMNGTSAAAFGPALTNPGPAWHEKTAADFNGDGKSDILWQNDNGTAAVWLMDGTGVAAYGPGLANPGQAWHATAAADFNGDGKADILWQNDNGAPGVWLMDGTGVAAAGPGLANPGPAWHEKAAADFNGDGKADILWQNDNGAAAVWLMDGANVAAYGSALANPGPAWHANAAADFNGDGKADILWQNDNGTAAVWLMDGTNVAALGSALANPGPAWHEKVAADFNGDHKADILWQNDNGTPEVWLMNGTSVSTLGAPLPDPGSDWHII